ALPHAILRL
nr:Chain C, Actin [Homo sapiens]3D2U_G Chain G, Actin [Homo sapiens]